MNRQIRRDPSSRDVQKTWYGMVGGNVVEAAPSLRCDLVGRSVHGEGGVARPDGSKGSARLTNAVDQRVYPGLRLFGPPPPFHFLHLP